jgi:hypothetical protein
LNQQQALRHTVPWWANPKSFCSHTIRLAEKRSAL